MKFGQGNVFTPVCDSIHMEGVSVRGVFLSGGVSVREGSRSIGVSIRETPPLRLRAGGTLPTVMHSCFHVVFGNKKSK